MNDTETLPVVLTVKHKIPVQRIKDLLCNAIEGGSNYWVESMDRMGGVTQTQAEYRQDVPFVDGGWLQVIEWEPAMPEYQVLPNRYKETFDGETKECYRVGLAQIAKGLQVFAEKYPDHFADFIRENDDATTGDVFFQCCVFGDCIYG